MDHIKSQTKSLLLPSFICALAALFYLYDYFIQVSPSVMTQSLMQDFSIGAGKLGILSACFYYSYTLMQIPAGMLLDRFGARKLLTFSVITSAIGVLLFSMAQHFASLCVARFLIGLGSSFAFISTLFLISRWFAHRYFAMGAGMVQLSGCVGSLIGLAPMALLIDHHGWRSAMFQISIFTFALAILFIFVIRDGEKPAKHHLDTKNEWQRLTALIKIKKVWLIAFCGLASWVPVATIGALWGVPYLMKVLHINNIQAGKICMFFWVGLGLGSPFMGWLSNRLNNHNKPFAWCYLFGIVGAILLILAPKLPVSLIVLAVFLCGFSASAQSLSFALLKDHVPDNLFGTASGFNNMGAILGGALSQPLVGYILHEKWQGKLVNNIPVYSIHDFQAAFIILPIAAYAGYFIARRIR
ncbi:MAG: MFS transporter [Gammaproteobacteria bacterium]|nr:MFS transporter [Gammaproteobacteria bacterium]MCH9744537.1 MFS transporter [Gammaproteobacteria bacterium]